MTAFYNEIDNYAADWLENLIAAGHIAPGIVDRRPIQEIEAYELVGFTQCHFFAGIGVWSHALRRAGWPDDQPIWTGSCPCQPFSNAGQQKGFSDDRHLWPYWEKLIGQCKPATVIGEQVASALDWLDLVSVDLEKQGYAFGASDLCAAGFDGAHIRQRLYFVGLANNGFSAGERNAGSILGAQEKISGENRPINGNSAVRFTNGSDAIGLGFPNGAGSFERQQGKPPTRHRNSFVTTGGPGGLADDVGGSISQPLGREDQRNGYPTALPENRTTNAPMLGRNAVDWLYCRDGKWRPVEPGTFPLVNETPARVGRLRAYGNALDFETAKAFCQAVKEIVDGV